MKDNRLFSMSGIKRDHSRFQDIVRGKIRENLKEYISQGEMLARKGKGTVSIPVPQIDVPRFIFGSNQKSGGVGQGDGEIGDPVDGQEQEGPGQGEAGNTAGEHELEIELSLEELAKMLGEELALPSIEPKGSKDIKVRSNKYKDVHRIGPNSLRHYKRTYREALKRQIAAGLYDPRNPVIIPIKEDFRFRGWADDVIPQTNAVVIHMMDVSGSMGDEQKEVVRTQAFWIDTWLRSQYKGVVTRYIIHDATAKEVDEDTFYRTRESGGTLISSAYKLMQSMIEKDYPTAEWNIYPFHFSDGDNWSNEDTLSCVKLLRDQILLSVNQFSYGQVESRYGSGQFFKDLLQHLGQEEKLVAVRIPDKSGIYDAIKAFLGAGR